MGFGFYSVWVWFIDFRINYGFFLWRHARRIRKESYLVLQGYEP